MKPVYIKQQNIQYNFRACEKKQKFYFKISSQQQDDSDKQDLQEQPKIRLQKKTKQDKTQQSEEGQTFDRKFFERNRKILEEKKQQQFSLDTINPILWGQRSRQALDSIWKSVLSLTNKSVTSYEDLLEDDTLTLSAEPGSSRQQNQFTTVLVVGATGQVGSIVVRKLVLRGYRVRAFVRRKFENKNGNKNLLEKQKEYQEELRSMFPPQVEFIQGDLTKYEDCAAAMNGVDKVIYCAAARETRVKKLKEVDSTGIKQFTNAYHSNQWLRASSFGFLNLPFHKRTVAYMVDSIRQYCYVDETFEENAQELEQEVEREFEGDAVNDQDMITEEGQKAEQQEQPEIQSNRYESQQYKPQGPGFSNIDDNELNMEDFQLQINEKNGNDLDDIGLRYEVVDPFNQEFDWKITRRDLNFLNGIAFFEGVIPRNEKATLSTELPVFDMDQLQNSQGLIIIMKGDGQKYNIVITTLDGHEYVVTFRTIYVRPQVSRFPFASFRPMSLDQPEIVDPRLIRKVSIQYEAKKNQNGAIENQIGFQEYKQRSIYQNEVNRFDMSLKCIKMWEGGAQEPTVIYVSCAGVVNPGEEYETYLRRMKHKKDGEMYVKGCGLPYTIVKPGQILEEPGGYNALIFDQRQPTFTSIAAADVADVCVRSLHQPLAVNKTFQVSNEYRPEEGEQLYELVAQVPGKVKDYVAAGLETLKPAT